MGTAPGSRWGWRSCRAGAVLREACGGLAVGFLGRRGSCHPGSVSASHWKREGAAAGVGGGSHRRSQRARGRSPLCRPRDQLRRQPCGHRPLLLLLGPAMVDHARAMNDATGCCSFTWSRLDAARRHRLDDGAAAGGRPAGGRYLYAVPPMAVVIGRSRRPTGDGLAGAGPCAGRERRGDHARCSVDAFTWRDGDRRIVYGRPAAGGAARGGLGSRRRMLLTTRRAVPDWGLPALMVGLCLLLPTCGAGAAVGGPVPPAGGVGMGRVIDAAKAIASVIFMKVCAIPEPPLSGADISSSLHPMRPGVGTLGAARAGAGQVRKLMCFAESRLREPP